jgi:uncharacterized membrane protein YvbJ
MHCKECGTQLTENSKFCNLCGQQIDDQSKPRDTLQQKLLIDDLQKIFGSTQRELSHTEVIENE